MSEPEYAGRLYALFKREGFDGEQIHFALSDGDEGEAMSGYESGAVEWANA